MLNINPDNKKLILSVDGGGVRGIITIAMLAELEVKTGKTCAELFDMVAGTSTGAIIAAGIGLGMSAKELLEEVYRTRLPQAFQSQPRGIFLYLRYLLGGLRHFYELRPFIEALGPFATGKKVRDFNRPIVFMTTRDVRTANTYYIVSKGPGAGRFANWPVTGAVGASGAAPVYFAPVLGNLIDGGVGLTGNPCLAATVEAMEYIGASEGFVDGNVIHFSMGTGYSPRTHKDGDAAGFWLLQWVRYIINQTLDDTTLEQVLMTRQIYGKRIDFRRYNPYIEDENVRDILGVSLEGRPLPSSIGSGLEDFDQPKIELLEAIGRAYANKVEWTEPGYLPWLDSGPDKGDGRDGGHPLPGIEAVNWSDSVYL
ncbi:MAG: patatin-like phospholipase family protein [Chloroflexi bacterium]|nr:patatin-like phospholipase family protein [Chloroflexota bacterium]MCC6895165.1 patatin-like phospholipase family protein [Anaerolineae bacterium]